MFNSCRVHIDIFIYHNGCEKTIIIMYLLIVSLPLLGSVTAGFGGRYLGARGAAVITTGSVALTAFLSILAFYEVALSGSPCSVALSPWFV